MQIRVRHAVSDDYDAACRLWLEADALHAAKLPDLFRTTDLPARSRSAFDRNIEDTESALLLAELDDAVVALVSVHVYEQADQPDMPALVPRRYAEIEELVVANAHRRRGIATHLMGAAHGWIRNRGINEVELTVYDFNEPALHLYRKLRYSPAGRRLWRRLD